MPGIIKANSKEDSHAVDAIPQFPLEALPPVLAEIMREISTLTRVRVKNKWNSSGLERVKGIEPSYFALWVAVVLSS